LCRSATPLATFVTAQASFLSWTCACATIAVLLLFFLRRFLVSFTCCLVSAIAALAAISALADLVVRTDLVESTTRLFFFLALLSAALLQSSVFSYCSISMPSSNKSMWLISFIITTLTALGKVSG